LTLDLELDIVLTNLKGLKMSGIKYFIFIFVLSITLIYPQNKYSVEANLGILSPFNSSSGLSGSGQLNYSLTDETQLFFNVLYGAWDRYNVFYEYQNYTSENPNPGPIKTFSADGHSLTSINMGSRFKLHENKIINLLFDAQLGLSFFSYNKYNLDEFTNPETGQIDLRPDLSSPMRLNETLLSIGIGPIFERKINTLLSLYLSVKLNTMINAGNIEFISKRGTYFLVSAGFTHTL